MRKSDIASYLQQITCASFQHILFRNLSVVIQWQSLELLEARVNLSKELGIYEPQATIPTSRCGTWNILVGYARPTLTITSFSCVLMRVPGTSTLKRTENLIHPHFPIFILFLQWSFFIREATGYRSWRNSLEPGMESPQEPPPQKRRKTTGSHNTSKNDAVEGEGPGPLKKYNRTQNRASSVSEQLLLSPLERILLNFYQACETCRHKKVRCDESSPTCAYCKRHGFRCEYPVPKKERCVRSPKI